MLQRWLVVIIGLPLLLAALLLCPDWVTVIVVCGIAAAAAYELLHTAGKKVPKCVYAFTILAAVAQEWVIYDAHTWQFYDSYQSVGMVRILCVPLVLLTVLFFVAVKSYGTPNAMPFADVATAMMGGTVFPMMYSAIFLLRMDGGFCRRIDRQRLGTGALGCGGPDVAGLRAELSESDPGRSGDQRHRPAGRSRHVPHQAGGGREGLQSHFPDPRRNVGPIRFHPVYHPVDLFARVRGYALRDIEDIL